MAGYESTKVELTCEFCGKSFRFAVSPGQKGTRKYCSRACFYSSMRKCVSRSCVYCGVIFGVLPYVFRKGGGKYCSTNCSNLAKHLPLKERFLSNVGPVTPSGCITWLGYTHKFGYGMISVVGADGKFRMLTAHRIAYESYYGPVPPKACVLHRCDFPLCINPQHLFLGSQVDNNNDKVSKGRQAKGETISQAKLTEEQVRDIRWLYGRGMLPGHIAPLFKVHDATIRDACQGRTWKHVT